MFIVLSLFIHHSFFSYNWHLSKILIEFDSQFRELILFSLTISFSPSLDVFIIMRGSRSLASLVLATLIFVFFFLISSRLFYSSFKFVIFVVNVSIEFSSSHALNTINSPFSLDDCCSVFGTFDFFIVVIAWFWCILPFFFLLFSFVSYLKKCASEHPCSPPPNFLSISHYLKFICAHFIHVFMAVTLPIRRTSSKF